MKKGDKLFKDEFVHFRWDDSLEGKMGFMEDGIGLLENKVAYGVGNTIHKADSIGFPFKSDNGNSWRFAYYDPHHEFKKAWLEGKKVQYMNVKNKWENVPDEWYWDGNDGTQYRIVPEKVLKPFKDVGELRKAWSIKETGRTDIVLAYELTEPMIWVRSKSNTKSTYLITHYCENVGVVYLCGYLNVSLEQLFENYTFLDGTPCGVEVEG
jgi:hypothetical protein